MYLGAVVNAVSLFLVNIILIRTIDTDAYGAFTLAVLTLTTLAEMSDLGLNGAITRFVPEFIKHGKTAALHEVVSIVYRLRIILSAGITITGLVFAPQIAIFIFGQPAIAEAIRIGFLGVGGVVLLGFVSTYLKATEQFVKNTWLQVLKGIIRVVAVLALSLTLAPQTPLLYIGIFVLVPWLILPFFLHVLPKKRTDSNQLSVGEKQTLKKEIASFSGWLVVWSFAAIIGTRVDQIMLSNMLSLEAVAIYAYGFQFVFAYSFLQQSFSAIIAPKMNIINSTSELQSFVTRSFKWGLFGSLGVSMITVVFVIFFRPTFFPDVYTASLPVFILIVLAMMIAMICMPYTQIITVYKKSKLTAISGLISLVVNIIGNAVLIPTYGTLGAAWAFFFSMTLSTVFSLIFGYRLSKNVELDTIF